MSLADSRWGKPSRAAVRLPTSAKSVGVSHGQRIGHNRRTLPGQPRIRQSPTRRRSLLPPRVDVRRLDAERTPDQNLRQHRRMAYRRDRPAGDAVPHERPPPCRTQFLGFASMVRQFGPIGVSIIVTFAHQMIEQQIALDIVVVGCVR